MGKYYFLFFFFFFFFYKICKLEYQKNLLITRVNFYSRVDDKLFLFKILIYENLYIDFNLRTYVYYSDNESKDIIQ